MPKTQQRVKRTPEERAALIVQSVRYVRQQAKKGISANQSLRLLRESGLGMRRTELWAELHKAGFETGTTFKATRAEKALPQLRIQSIKPQLLKFGYEGIIKFLNSENDWGHRLAQDGHYKAFAQYFKGRYQANKNPIPMRYAPNILSSTDKTGQAKATKTGLPLQYQLAINVDLKNIKTGKIVSGIEGRSPAVHHIYSKDVGALLNDCISGILAHYFQDDSDEWVVDRVNKVWYEISLWAEEYKGRKVS